MAILIGIQTPNGEWDNFVMTREPRDVAGSVDILGRTVPCFSYVEGYDGIPREEAERLANSLKGRSKKERHQAFLDTAKNLGLRKRLSGGTLK